MDKAMKIIFPVLLCVMIVAVPSLRAMWIEDGIPVVATADDQLDPAIDSDEEGGAFIAWEDFDSGTGYSAIKVQKINAMGNTGWAAGGIPVFTGYMGSDYQYNPVIASNGYGGTIVVWENSDYGDSDIYLQMISPSGTPLLTEPEIILCEASYDQTEARVITYYGGSAIIAWQDERGGDYHIYAQRINSSGTAQWPVDGLPLCRAAGNQTMPVITSGIFSPAIVAWNDYRNGNYDIYAQTIDSQGRIGYFPPVIESVSDIPGDEGGWVRITVDRTSWDAPWRYTNPASLYNIWQRIDDPAMTATAPAHSRIRPGAVTRIRYIW